MNEEVNMAEKIKLTNNVGAFVADNQNVMTAGPGFCA
jgi:catalase